MDTEGSGRSTSYSICQKTRGLYRYGIQASAVDYFWWRTKRSYFKLSAEKTAAREKKVTLCEGKRFYLKTVELSRFFIITTPRRPVGKWRFFLFILNLWAVSRRGRLVSCTRASPQPIQQKSDWGFDPDWRPWSTENLLYQDPHRNIPSVRAYNYVEEWVSFSADVILIRVKKN